MIAKHYLITETEAEMLDIDIYRLRLFTIFNDAILHSFDPKGFQYQTEEERIDEFLYHVEQAKKQGYSF